ncbi:MAG: alpha-ketoacid dehydrogenase subunit beta [Deltaproteobacteria bacterium]|nr:alpha-ketoacid dehydrogenase subunit beta [Deltaproteobacteria bacterium]
MAETTYLEAIRQALFEEMHRDQTVFCLGQDIGHFGGAFKVTRGLLETFGPSRVIDMPIAESAIVGVAIGAALRGLRPVAEMQFADFVTGGFSQLVNNAATFHYRLGVSVPMVVRLPSGGGVGGGPFHSRNPEAWFTHAPGLKVVAPATPRDARRLLKAAIRDPDPVIFLEQKYLYRRLKEDLEQELEDADYADYADGAEGSGFEERGDDAVRASRTRARAEGEEEDSDLLAFGRARVARRGEHVSIVTYANGVGLSLDAAHVLGQEGIQVEVLDLRTLVPWDYEAVLKTVAKTGRLLVVQEATRTTGFASEVCAVVAELGFENLDAPIRRVTAPDTPTPSEQGLEAFVRPNCDRIVEALRWLLAY